MEDRRKKAMEQLRVLDELIHTMINQKMRDSGQDYRGAMELVKAETPELFRQREAVYQEAGRNFSAGFYTLVDGELRRVETELEKVAQDALSRNPGMSQKAALSIAASERPDLIQNREVYRRALQR